MGRQILVGPIPGKIVEHRPRSVSHSLPRGFQKNHLTQFMYLFKISSILRSALMADQPRRKTPEDRIICMVSMNEIFVGTHVQNTTTTSPTKTKEKWESTQLFRVGRFMFVGQGSKDIWHNNQHGRHELEGLWILGLRTWWKFSGNNITLWSLNANLWHKEPPQDSGNDCYVEGDGNSLGALFCLLLSANVVCTLSGILQDCIPNRDHQGHEPQTWESQCKNETSQELFFLFPRQFFIIENCKSKSPVNNDTKSTTVRRLTKDVEQVCEQGQYPLTDTARDSERNRGQQLKKTSILSTINIPRFRQSWRQIRSLDPSRNCNVTHVYVKVHIKIIIFIFMHIYIYRDKCDRCSTWFRSWERSKKIC